MPIRRPSSHAQLYGWWRAAVAGENPSIHEGDPQCGWYRRRLVKGGPYVQVRIFVRREIDPETGELLGPEEIACEVEGLPADPHWHWTYLTPISREEYDRLGALIASSSAMWDSRKPLDLTQDAMGPNG